MGWRGGTGVSSLSLLFVLCLVEFHDGHEMCAKIFGCDEELGLQHTLQRGWGDFLLLFFPFFYSLRKKNKCTKMIWSPKQERQTTDRKPPVTHTTTIREVGQHTKVAKKLKLFKIYQIDFRHRWERISTLEGWLEERTEHRKQNGKDKAEAWILGTQVEALTWVSSF